MLTTQALQSGQSIMSELDARTIVVTPVTGTILDRLCKATNAKEAGVIGNPGDWGLDLGYLSSITEAVDPATGYSDHTLTLEEVKVIGGAVSNHLKHARTVVAPLVDDFVQRITPALEEATRNSMTSLEIVQAGLPGVLLEPALLDSAERAKDIPVDSFNLGMRLPALSAQEIKGHMLSGVASLDQAIEQYVAGVGDDQLERIWKTLFGVNETSAVDAITTFNADVDYAIVGFLVSRKLWDAPIEGVEMNLRAYETEMLRLRDQSALHILRVVARQETDERSGVLIRSYTRTKVQVNAVVYKQFIQEGGSNEVLFGNVLSKRPIVMLGEIAEHAEEFKQNWERYCLMNRTAEANKRFELAKQCVRLEFDAYVRDASQDDLPLQEREFVVKCFNEALAATREDDVLNPYKWILQLLCSSVFRKTDALRILAGIDRIKAASPDVDVREAAAVSACEYIAWWVAQQFRVEAGVAG